MKTISLTPKDIERFWKKVNTQGDCWEWTASLHPEGYGQLRVTVDGKQSTGLAHRISFQIRHGRTPTNYVDHACRNRRCVNPAHLREVTNKQNMENRKGPNANNTSGVQGVRRGVDGKWRAEVMHHGKLHSAGAFDSLDAAATAVTALRNELFTHNDTDKKGIQS